LGKNYLRLPSFFETTWQSLIGTMNIHR
jgi:hypothetical protein